LAKNFEEMNGWKLWGTEMAFWVILIIISIVASFGWYNYYSYLCKDNQTNFVNITGGVGTILSLIGLIITIYGWHQTKKEVKNTNAKVTEALGQFKKLDNLSEVSKAIGIAEEIQILLQKKRYEAVWLKMSELNKILISFEQQDFSKVINPSDFQDNLVDFQDSFQNVNEYLLGNIKKEGITSTTISNSIFELTQHLIKIQYTLKNSQ
jgi:hypothetical protein